MKKAILSGLAALVMGCSSAQYQEEPKPEIVQEQIAPYSDVTPETKNLAEVYNFYTEKELGNSYALEEIYDMFDVNGNQKLEQSEIDFLRKNVKQWMEIENNRLELELMKRELREQLNKKNAKPMRSD